MLMLSTAKPVMDRNVACLGTDLLWDDWKWVLQRLMILARGKLGFSAAAEFVLFLLEILILPSGMSDIVSPCLLIALLFCPFCLNTKWQCVQFTLLTWSEESFFLVCREDEVVDSAAAGRHVYKKSAEIFSAVVSVFTIFSPRLNTVHRVLLNKPNQLQ